MRKTYALLAAASVLASTPALAATTFRFDTDPANTFVRVTSNPTGCVFGGCRLSASVAAPLPTFTPDVGESRTFDFARFTVGSGFGAGSATIDAQLGFVLPVSGPAGTDGSATYLRAGGIFSPGAVAGSLTWGTPSQQLTAADGSRFTVTFGDLAGAQFGGTSVAPVTITLNSDAVPEPATWATMILGFGAIGGAMRSARVRRKVSYAV